MLDPTAMILADRATKAHVRSALPDAPTTPAPLRRRRTGAARRLTVTGLRRLADRLERRPACNTPVAAS